MLTPFGPPPVSAASQQLDAIRYAVLQVASRRARVDRDSPFSHFPVTPWPPGGSTPATAAFWSHRSTCDAFLLERPGFLAYFFAMGGSFRVSYRARQRNALEPASLPRRPRSPGHSARMRIPAPPALLGLLILSANATTATTADGFRLEESVDVAEVWAGHPVGFALLTHRTHQFVAFYDTRRQTTVATRALGSERWQSVRLDSRVAWDSHNYIVMAVDNAERLHLAGNMHSDPLRYWRTRAPLDIATSERIPSMVGQQEERCTYPRFLKGPNNTLVFNYRDGGSGNGRRFFNVYSEKTQTWRRLIDGPLFEGGGRMNAYFRGPRRDRSGTYHVAWVWRDSPDCATNHDLSYARSRDLVHWETSRGEPLTLPLTIQNGEVVDPVPIRGGLLNSNIRIGFDRQDRVILTYHKFDAEGYSQVYNARLEGGTWRIYRTSDWTYRWWFHAGGSILQEITVSPVVPASDGSLSQRWRHAKYGSGRWRLDETTLTPQGELPDDDVLPADLLRAESTHPNMAVRTAADLGEPTEPGVRYMLRWETLPANRDYERRGDLPAPTMLKLLKLRRK